MLNSETKGWDKGWFIGKKKYITAKDRPVANSIFDLCRFILCTVCSRPRRTTRSRETFCELYRPSTTHRVSFCSRPTKFHEFSDQSHLFFPYILHYLCIYRKIIHYTDNTLSMSNILYIIVYDGITGSLISM